MTYFLCGNKIAEYSWYFYVILLHKKIVIFCNISSFDYSQQKRYKANNVVNNMPIQKNDDECLRHADIANDDHVECDYCSQQLRELSIAYYA